MMREITEVLEIQLKHATVKHPQTVGAVERSHSSVKKVMKMFENYTSTDWPTYLPLCMLCSQHILPFNDPMHSITAVPWP